MHVEVSQRWDADATLLPTRKVGQHGIDSDLSHLAFDNCFEGWRGPARLRDERFSLQLSSSLSRLVVYTPPERDYFCVEPVSHVSNAIHMAEPAAHGLVALAPGATHRGDDGARGRRRLTDKMRIMSSTSASPSTSPRCSARVRSGTPPNRHSGTATSPAIACIASCRRPACAATGTSTPTSAAQRRAATVASSSHCATVCGVSIRCSMSASSSLRRPTTRPTSASTTANAIPPDASGSARSTSRAGPAAPASGATTAAR